MQNNQSYRLQSLLVGFFMFLILGFNVLTQDNLHILLTAGFLVIHSMLSWKQLLPRLFFILIPLTVFVYMLGSEYTLNLYDQISWFDNVVHFLATFVITLLIGFLSNKTSLRSVRSEPWLFIIVIAGLGITLGVLWEFVEWSFDTFIRPIELITVYDLITDLMIDSLGALSAGVVSLFLIHEK